MFPISRLLRNEAFGENMFKESRKIWKSMYAYSTTTPKEAKELGSVIEGRAPRQHYGQPTPLTHPHLLKPGEVVRGLQKKEFIERRKNFIHNLLKSNPKNNHVVIIPSATKVYMSEKIPYVFRQNTDFLYLTGCQEPDSALVITVPNEDNASCILFVRKKDKHAEKWDGPRTGVQGALELFGVDQALPFSELSTFLSSYAQTYKQYTLWYDFDSNIHPEVHSVMKTFSSRITEKPGGSPKPLLHQQRLIKSPAEQDLMAHTCEIACKAMAQTIAFTRPGVTEHQLFAKMDYECRMQGADFLAYPPVVAAGNNANTIHYIANTQTTRPGEMVLMDAGCSLSGYCSDLTRTWPVTGQFTRAQLVLYDIVLQTQQQLMTLCHPAHSLDHLFNNMCHLLGQKLIEAGVFKKTANKDHPSRMAYELCPHHTSHYLGMDVHDTGTVSRSMNMKPGMVITVEPGLYISENNENVNEEFCGQGIRIEDNILVTESNPILLTGFCPKEPEVIESMVGTSLS